jgi:hypothetical protein
MRQIVFQSLRWQPKYDDNEENEDGGGRDKEVLEDCDDNPSMIMMKSMMKTSKDWRIVMPTQVWCLWW